MVRCGEGCIYLTYGDYVRAEGAVESGGWAVQHLGRAQRPVASRQVPTAAHRPPRLRRHTRQGTALLDKPTFTTHNTQRLHLVPL